MQIFHRYAEFVFIESRCYFLVSMSVYVWIDTEGDVGCFFFLSGQLVNDFKLGNTLYIEASNIIIQSEIDLPIALPYSGKNYF